MVEKGQSGHRSGIVTLLASRPVVAESQARYLVEAPESDQLEEWDPDCPCPAYGEHVYDESWERGPCLGCGEG